MLQQHFAGRAHPGGRRRTGQPRSGDHAAGGRRPDVDTADDGEQAVAMARNTAYAAILMDMQMPRTGRPGGHAPDTPAAGYADTPIIAMTANAFAEDKARCFEAGMNDFLAKPFDPAGLDQPRVGQGEAIDQRVQQRLGEVVAAFQADLVEGFPLELRQQHILHRLDGGLAGHVALLDEGHFPDALPRLEQVEQTPLLGDLDPAAADKEQAAAGLAFAHDHGAGRRARPAPVMDQFP
jgi:CheY-like chemotaxis protein